MSIVKDADVRATGSGPDDPLDESASRAAAEFAHLGVGELTEMCACLVTELGRRVALAQYGTTQAITHARELAGARVGQPTDARELSDAGAVEEAARRDGERSEVDASPAVRALRDLAVDGPALSGSDALALSSGPYAVDLLQLAMRASEQLRAVAGLAAARVDAMGLWAADGSRSVNAWSIRTLGVSPGMASRLVRTGRLVRDHTPALGRAVLAGKATWDHAVAARHAASSQVRREALAESTFVDHMGFVVTGDEQLAYQVGSLDAGQFEIVVKHGAAKADPEADERGYKEAQEREYVDLAPTLGGYHLEGFLTEEHGKLVKTAIEGVIGVPAADDARTPAQRRAQGLADVANISLSQGEVGTSGGVKPQIVVTVPFETLQAMAARTASEIDLDKLVGLEPAQWADGTGPLPPGLLARLACDSAIARVVFGPAGEVLNQGRTYRTFTAAQRAALVARDRCCAFTGCTAPPKQCEGHHLVFWSNGGRTDIDNAVLLCWFHHRYIHANQITITLTRNGFIFTRPTGEVIA